MLVRRIDACRACGDRRLEEVLDLGNLAISDFLEPGQEVVDRAPLTLVRCALCGLVQLRDTVDRDRLYRTYHYRSGVNETMLAALEDVVDDAMSRVDLETGDAVLDIGCNDATLLGRYPNWTRRIGYDPSDVALEAWRGHSFRYDLVRDYFPTRRQHIPVPCKIVTAIACFYDVDDPGAFLDEARRWLHPEGVLVLQFQDLESMVLANAIDNVCHEHLTFWGPLPLGRLLQERGLRMVDASPRAVNGGSIRVTIRHGRSVAPNWGTHDVWRAGDWSLDQFAARVVRNKALTLRYLERLRRAHKRVYGIAASTKWGTLSQYYGIGPELVQAIGERSPHKVGKRTVTGIPIISEEQMRQDRPDYLLCCAWGFADAFAQREAELLAGGTRMIVPLPYPRIVQGAPVASDRRPLVA